MGIIWVTGISGSGKSSACERLREQGYTAIDADWEGFSHWARRSDGERISDPPYPVPPGWLDEHGWYIDVDRVASLAAGNRDSRVFLCGSVENETDVRQFFDAIVCLVADDETITRRLASRTNNAFGTHPEELAAVLAWNGTQGERYRLWAVWPTDAGVLSRPRPGRRSPFPHEIGRSGYRLG